MLLLDKDSNSAQQIGLECGRPNSSCRLIFLRLYPRTHSSAPQRQEFARANVLLDSIETKNFVQATLF